LSKESEGLLLKASDYLAAKNYSPRTIRNYTSEMRYIFCYYNEKSRKEITQDDIIHYLNFIKKQFGSGYDKCRMVAQWCSFFYKNILQVPYLVPSSFYPRKEFKLPNILSEKEVKHLLSSITNKKHKCLLSMFYGSGLRLDEMSHLKMCDLDSENGQLKVVNGKGNKHRMSIFPKHLLADLREYYKSDLPKTYLFEGRKEGFPMSNGSIQVAVRNSMVGAGFERGRYSAHSLRHSFATHLLDNGTDLHTIKVLLGHSKIETTMVYLHLQKSKRAKIQSPFDSLFPIKEVGGTDE
jgi:site-specific recombinase XerD